MSAPPHVQAYVAARAAAGQPAPELVERLTRAAKERRPYNLVYRVSDDIWVHITEGSQFPRYTAIEPPLDERTRALVEAVRDEVFRRVPEEALPAEPGDYKARLAATANAVLDRQGAAGPLRQAVAYHALKGIVGAQELEPLIRDPWIEDIHAMGAAALWPVHKVFGACKSNVEFADTRRLDGFLGDLSEGMGRPVSPSRPIVDGALADGSRINIVYSEGISVGGSSFTIRKFSDVPTAVTQLIAWGTFDATLGAYLWLCMENGMSVFVSGETASGKTTTLNGLLPFVPRDAKILTAEDTPEVRPPHGNWQQLVTRDSAEAGSRVDMGDLLKVGLRSRPDRIIVGEIRGVEGAVAFQAMQTGYPTYATFHASSVGKLIQRLTSAPISVPPQFMPNLNVVLVQLAVHVGGRRLRRVIEVEEIEGYSRSLKSPVTRQVFRWDPVQDKHEFSGRNNSFVLENLVAPRLGLGDPREVYAELERRKAILEDLVGRAQFDYEPTLEAIEAARRRPE
ncbi:MAG TPA: type II/IV secretion system ATPase subunit [Candidatus Thermoplasmatota archaeon]|nr:type II/IV secretion system ATPase subunit [Candidatus Thermoplasmatota archaeon]